jgi:endonuclease YncB( thermonuclease family)
MPKPIVLFVLATAALLAPAVSAQTMAVKVVSIGDGDTLRIQEGRRVSTVRLACIDAPEMAQAPWGQQARQQLQALVPLGAVVDLRRKAIDRYGRLVAELSRGGLNINQALVSSGAAFVYWQFIQGCDRQTYSRLETEARLRKIGVWSSPDGITRPWDFRRGRRQGVALRGMTSDVGHRYRCREIGSFDRAQELLHQGHSYLDGDGDGEACESLR